VIVAAVRLVFLFVALRIAVSAMAIFAIH
jgi:hypothetical protein